MRVFKKNQKKRKVYVFDTSALINDPCIITRIGKKPKAVIPVAVLKQLDGLKNNQDDSVGYKARKAAQTIEDMQQAGRAIIENNHLPVDMLDNQADNRVVGTAGWLRDQGCDAWLVTTDRNMRIAARASGVKVGEPVTKKDRVTSLLDYVYNNFLAFFALYAFVCFVSTVADGRYGLTECTPQWWQDFLSRYGMHVMGAVMLLPWVFVLFWGLYRKKLTFRDLEGEVFPGRGGYRRSDDDDMDVVTNPAFKDLRCNAFYEERDDD